MPSFASVTGFTPTTATEIAPQHERTAPRPPEQATFGNVLKRGAGLLLRGAEVGAAVALGPIVPLAVRGGLATAAAATGGGMGGGGGGVAGLAGPLGHGGGEQSSIDQMRAMQADSQAFNLQYMALQEEVQQENRRFTTVSNVLKAKHETAKGAIGNIRA